MITSGEIRRRARDLDLQERHIERDYVLNHLLATISVDISEAIFRGGTALARVYWPDFRLSEDLDFIHPSGIKDLEPRLRDVIAKAAELTSRPLELDFGTPRDGWSRSLVSWDGNELLIDFNMSDSASMAVKERELHLPYSDLKEADRSVSVLDVREILGNKWWMLQDRKEPRDLYDLWAALCKFEVPFADIVAGYKEKYGRVPIKNFIDLSRRHEELWEERLAHQVPDLPSFKEAQGAVRKRAEEWFLKHEESK